VPHSLLHKPSVRQQWRLKVYNLVTSTKFEGSIIFVIVLNMCQMALSYEGSSETVKYLTDVTNLIFTSIFIVEAALKLFAFGLAYFGTSWNKFDFFVIIASIIDILLSADQLEGVSQHHSALSVAPQLARVLRVLRVSRVLRIAGRYKGL